MSWSDTWINIKSLQQGFWLTFWLQGGNWSRHKKITHINRYTALWGSTQTKIVQAKNKLNLSQKNFPKFQIVLKKISRNLHSHSIPHAIRGIFSWKFIVKQLVTSDSVSTRSYSLRREINSIMQNSLYATIWTICTLEEPCCQYDRTGI